MTQAEADETLDRIPAGAQVKIRTTMGEAQVGGGPRRYAARPTRAKRDRMLRK